MASRRKNPFTDLLDLDFSTAERRARSNIKLLKLFSLVALIGTVAWFASNWAFGGQDLRVRIRGANVSALKPNALVIMDGIQVGHVQGVTLEDGQAVAYLSIESQWADQIPAGSQYKVGSLNLILPGNVGVTVIPPSDGGGGAGEIVDDDIRDVLASDRVLPVQTPLGMFISIALVVVAAAMFLVIVYKLASIAVFWKIAVVTVIAAILFLFGTGRLSFDDFKDTPLPDTTELTTGR